MGTDKNIKLHIVTDIKVLTTLIHYTNSTKRGHVLKKAFRKAAKRASSLCNSKAY